MDDCKPLDAFEAMRRASKALWNRPKPTAFDVMMKAARDPKSWKEPKGNDSDSDDSDWDDEDFAFSDKLEKEVYEIGRDMDALKKVKQKPMEITPKLASMCKKRKPTMNQLLPKRTTTDTNPDIYTTRWILAGSSPGSSLDPRWILAGSSPGSSLEDLGMHHKKKKTNSEGVKSLLEITQRKIADELPELIKEALAKDKKEIDESYDRCSKVLDSGKNHICKSLDHSDEAEALFDAHQKFIKAKKAFSQEKWRAQRRLSQLQNLTQKKIQEVATKNARRTNRRLKKILEEHEARWTQVDSIMSISKHGTPILCNKISCSRPFVPSAKMGEVHVMGPMQNITRSPKPCGVIDCPSKGNVCCDAPHTCKYCGLRLCDYHKELHQKSCKRYCYDCRELVENYKGSDCSFCEKIFCSDCSDRCSECERLICEECEALLEDYEMREDLKDCCIDQWNLEGVTEFSDSSNEEYYYENFHEFT